MSGASIKIGISPRNLPVPKFRTEPAWRKPVVEYPKDATVIEIPYKWDRKPEKPGKKEKQKPKPITIRKQKPKPAKKAEPKKEKVKRTYSVLTGKERHGWTEDEIEKLIRMYEDGASYIEIMEAVRHSESSIATKLTVLRKEGRITSIRSKEAWTQEEVDTLLTMKAQGHNLEQISKAMGKTYASVWCKYRKIKEKECEKE